MAATNRRAVSTTVKKELPVNIVDINKAIGLISDVTTITDLKKLYTTLDEVAVDFLTTSEFYAMAKTYFAEGGTVLYAVPVDGYTSGYMTTIPIAVGSFTAISDGTFDVDIDGATVSTTGLDFSAATSEQNVADIISAALVGATVTLGIGNALVITSDTASATSAVINMAVGGVGTDISALIAQASITAATRDIIAKLTELENDNDPNFSFVMMGMDKTLAVTDQITIGAQLTQFVFGKDYEVCIDTIAADVLTSVTTDVVSTNKNFYDNLSGDDLLKLGNVNFFYTDEIGDFVSFGVIGKLMSLDIGSQTVKFMKPKNSAAVTMTNSELTNVLNKQANVYTGTNERIGRSFIKEGLTLKDGDFTDTSLGAIWIKVQLDNILYDLFQTKKVTINNDGFTLAENQVSPIFEQAVVQGIIDGNADVPFKISFSAGNLATREIIGTYSYTEGLAGHFITNTVTITQGA